MSQDTPLGIGFFDNKNESEPAIDEATICPACGQSLAHSARPVKVVLIHCTRWPIATFYRIHKDEIPLVTREAYHEITVKALELRHRIERQRSAIPSAFLNMFKDEAS